MRKIGLIVLIAVIAIFATSKLNTQSQNEEQTTTNISENEGGPEQLLPHPLTIESLRNGDYPGSDIAIEQKLSDGSNYERFIASYKSEGLKIYALMTIPKGTKPESGWPVVIFNHGFIQPSEYRTTERYIAYTDAFSRNGYIVFRSDYRGHGNSEGNAAGGYGSNDYTIDVLNAVSSIKKYPGADINRIGMWGHSMGGHITLRSMVVSPDIKAGVIWAGVVGSYPDLLNNWRRGNSTPRPQPSPLTGSRRWRQALIEEFGKPEQNPTFWNSISSTTFIPDISGPLQLHHGTADSSVPIEFSQKLNDQMKESGKTVELFVYSGDDHNLSKNFSPAINRSVDFFDKYMKGGD